MAENSIATHRIWRPKTKAARRRRQESPAYWNRRLAAMGLGMGEGKYLPQKRKHNGKKYIAH